ncbi:MarR family winged helix-turn-helix transcriptional regulator, partial [Staphylococcus aureus]|uniref:MarR family winged helix-turn-helix transcriptional regulator n=1 Tax=Staphylococcus aureus TaxID=1280 RepID=UPI00065B49DF
MYYLLSTTQNIVFKHFKRLLIRLNITPAEYGVLNCLINSNVNTTKAIANTLNIEPSTISRILDKTSKKDLRTREAGDRCGRNAAVIWKTQVDNVWVALG